MALRPPHFAPKAKRVVYLHMSGGPPQQDLFDWKPELVKHHMKPCPDELLKNQRFAFIKGHPKLLGTPYQFQKSGQCGALVSELLPHLRSTVDDIAIVKSMYTDQFNHVAGRAVPLHGLIAQRRRGDGFLDHIRPGYRE